jgi:hypothetical protein
MREDGRMVTATTTTGPPTPLRDTDGIAIDLLERQLERMRGMLAAYSMLFFGHMRWYATVAIALLVAALWPPLGAAACVVPFLVPFVFLEASYLFWYTVFARRHAEHLEREIDARLGADVLVAHRIEAAWFYEPDGRKVSALSLGRPLGHMSAATIGYTAGAAILWLVGLLMGVAWLDRNAAGEPLAALLAVAAVAWTAVIVVYLLWAWLGGADERRLERALEAGYPGAAQGRGEDRPRA